MIEFAWENQGNWSARCLAGQADSPVYTNAGDGGGSSAFEVVRDSLNAFLITLCLQEAVMSAPVLYAIDGPPWFRYLQVHPSISLAARAVRSSRLSSRLLPPSRKGPHCHGRWARMVGIAFVRGGLVDKPEAAEAANPMSDTGHRTRTRTSTDRFLGIVCIYD